MVMEIILSFSKIRLTKVVFSFDEVSDIPSVSDRP
jgi:hypothetical protein